MTLVAVSETVTAAGRVAAHLLGIAMLSGILAALIAVGYRWYVRERVPIGLALLVGLTGVSVVMGTTNVLANAIGDPDQPLEVLSTLFNIGAFAAGGIGAYAGIKTGDGVGTDFFVAAGGSDVDADVSEIVQSVGRVISVGLPEEIDDVVGYDPVPDATKETLGGRTFLFPRRLTKAELRDRLVARLKTDYGVGHVDVELGEGGAVEYLALGARAAGIGPTLPPATNAVAVQADPANAASAGDLVQVWETDPSSRVLTGELRGVVGDVVTVAIDAADTPKLDPTANYKLVTLPVQDRPDREFASLLRAADETLSTVTVEAGSALDGAALESLPVTVVAITRDDTPPEPLPAMDRRLAPGDVLYAIATPDALRKTEAAAKQSVGEHGGSPEPTSPPSAGESRPMGSEPGTENGPSPTESEPSTEASPDTDRPESGPSDSSVDAQTGQREGERSEPADGVSEAEEPTGDSAADAGQSDPESDAASDATDGAAFPDAEDLPGLDAETEVPSLGLDDEGDVEAAGEPSANGESGLDDAVTENGEEASVAADANDGGESDETDAETSAADVAAEDDPLADVLTADGNTDAAAQSDDATDDVDEEWSFEESEDERSKSSK